MIVGSDAKKQGIESVEYQLLDMLESLAVGKHTASITQSKKKKEQPKKATQKMPLLRLKNITKKKKH